jgi:hypothetical protein
MQPEHVPHWRTYFVHLLKEGVFLCGRVVCGPSGHAWRQRGLLNSSGQCSWLAPDLQAWSVFAGRHPCVTLALTGGLRNALQQEAPAAIALASS